jgi:predicted nucleic acid-binding protein
MAIRLLFDTDVIIDYLRDQSDAVQYLENRSEILLISSIVVAELYSGLRDEPEREALEKFLKAFEVVPVNQEIAIKGGTYRRDYNKSHGTGLADALIAATADIRQAKLVTLNKKHFPMLEDIIAPYQKT